MNGNRMWTSERHVFGYPLGQCQRPSGSLMDWKRRHRAFSCCLHTRTVQSTAAGVSGFLPIQLVLHVRPLYSLKSRQNRDAEAYT